MEGCDGDILVQARQLRREWNKVFESVMNRVSVSGKKSWLKRLQFEKIYKQQTDSRSVAAHYRTCFKDHLVVERSIEVYGV